MVVPTHDRRELLAVTLSSVCAQRDVGLEVLVVDDGSATSAAHEVVAEVGDPRVRLLRNATPQGVSAARNRGITEATGKWLAFCDDDDVWAPDKLSAQLAAAEDGRAWIYAGAVKVDRALRVLGGDPPAAPEAVHRRLPRWSLVPGGCSGVIARRDLVGHVGGFDPRLVNLADWDLWIRLSRNGPPGWVARPLVGYRIHGGNASGDTALVLRELEILDGRYGVRMDHAAVHHYLAWVSLRGRRRRQAGRHFLQAAVGGEVGGVARSLATLAGGRLRAVADRTRRAPTAWQADAEGWLQALR